MKRIFIVITLFFSIFLISCDFNLGGFGVNIENPKENENIDEVEIKNQFDEMYIVAQNQGFSGSKEDWMNDIIQGNLEFKLVDNMIYWSYKHNENFLPIINISELLVNSNSNVEFKYSGNYLKWKYKDETIWHDLLQLFEAVKTYNVTFIDSMTGELYYQISIEAGKILNMPINPTKEGYIFSGWEYNGVIWNDDNEVNQDTILVAKWKKVEDIKVYKVDFLDEFGNEIYAPINVNYGEKIEQPVDPIKEGYIFIGWMVNGEKWDFDNLVFQDITLVAKCKKVEDIKVYKVDFLDEDGAIIFASNYLEEGLKVINPGTPIKDGYKFLGWYYNDLLWDFDNFVFQDITLVAKWNQIIIDERLQKFADEIVDLFNDVVIESKMETTQSDFINTTHPNIKEVFSNLENLSKYKWFLEYILDEMTKEVTEKNMLDDTNYVETKELLEKLIAFDVNAINEMYPNGRTALRNFIHHLVNAENPLMEPSRNVYDFMCVDYKNHPEKLAEFLELYENHKEDFKDLIIIIDDTECFVNTKIGWNAAPYPSLENFEIVYSVSDESLATIDDSYITLLNPGTVVISFYLKDYDIIKKLTIEIIEEESSDYKTINYDYNGGYPQKYGYETDKERVINNFLKDLYNHFLEQGAFQHKVVDIILVEDSTLPTPTFEEFSSRDYWTENYAKYAHTILSYYLFTPYCDVDGNINENYKECIEGSDKFFNTKVGQYWLPIADWVNEATQYAHGAGQDFWGRDGLPYVPYDLLAKQSYYVASTMYKNHTGVNVINKGALLGAYRFAQYVINKLYIFQDIYGEYVPGKLFTEIIYNEESDLIIPERDGYEFLGWSKTLNSNEYITSTKEIYETEVTLYANWKIKDDCYIIQFINDGVVIFNELLLNGTEFIIPQAYKMGYLFKGWSLDLASGEITEVSNIASKNVTYYAVWENLGDIEKAYVDPNYSGNDSNYFNTLEEALININDGGYIYLAPGYYYEDIQIYKNNVTICGPNNGVNPNELNRNEEAVFTGIINIYSRDVTIDGITLSGKGQICGEGTENLTIKNTILKDYSFGQNNINCHLLFNKGINKNLLIDSCRMEKVDNQRQIFLIGFDIDGLTVINCEMYGPYDLWNDCIRIYSSIITESSFGIKGYINISNNIFAGFRQYAIWFNSYANGEFIINNNKFINCGEMDYHPALRLSNYVGEFNGANVNFNYNQLDNLPLMIRVDSGDGLNLIANYNIVDTWQNSVTHFVQVETGVGNIDIEYNYWAGWTLDEAYFVGANIPHNYYESREEVDSKKLIEYDFKYNFDIYTSNWANVYSENVITYSDMNILTPEYNFILSRSMKQTTIITDCPVIASKGGDTQYVTIQGEFDEIDNITFDLKQWNIKEFDEIYIEYTIDGINWITCSDIITKPSKLSTNIIINNAKEVRLVYTSNHLANTQMGLSAIVFTLN